ncbi:MAG: GHKL domain-containing protein [Gammaproteobacteria bacterium]|nr:GHKL domain-containing protein [Gammaproteobacteria bacterium]
MARRPGSVSVRLLASTTLVLLAAFAGSIALLDALFRQTSEEAIRDVLEVQVLTLIGLAEPADDGSLALPADLPETRLNAPSSGLFAEIVDPIGERVWRSPSAVGIDLASGLTVGSGERLYQRRVLSDGTEALILGIGITWELVGDATYGFQVFVGEDLAAYQRRLARFRQQLFGWFAAVMVALIVTIWLLLRAGLRPLSRMEREITAIEKGEAELLDEDYPRELVGVARNMNALVRSERQRISRFRTTMDDLAHSLKTPIAVLRSELEAEAPESGVLRDQVARMQGVVDYQLRRAAATGPRTLAPTAVKLAPICREIASSLRKIHAEKSVDFDLRVPDGTTYPAEQGDLYELVGNLLDNAWKYCRTRVTIDVEIAESEPGKSLLIRITDDGPGIPEDEINQVLNRGHRAEAWRGDAPGQGIGLAVVAEIVGLYGGGLQISSGAARNGTTVEVRLPIVER